MFETNPKVLRRAALYALTAAFVTVAIEVHWVWDSPVPLSEQGWFYYLGKFGIIIVATAVIGALAGVYFGRREARRVSNAKTAS